MIGRWYLSAVLTLPLSLSLSLAHRVDAQAATAPRATWSTAVPERTQDDGPLVRVWIPGTWTFHYRQPVQVMFEVSEDAHVAVFRVDGSGRLSVLWPTRRSLQTAARAGREYRVSGPYSAHAAFNADYEFGSGMVIAIASYDPIDLTAFRRYRNDQSFYHYANFQRPYIGGVRHVVDRISQEILYHPDSPFDYDVAFYNVQGRSFFSNASYGYCDADYYYGYPRTARYSYGATGGHLPLGWDSCRSPFYNAYWAYCASWAAINGYAWCRPWNPSWPVPPIAGPGPQPQQPVNVGMIDSIMTRPVDKYPIIENKTENPTTNATTHIVRMEPARDGPNVTRWIPEDENSAISIPRLRGSQSDAGGRPGGHINTRDEGYRSPGTTIRAGDQPPPIDRSGGAFMPPVRQPPREPPVWRDNGRIDRGGGGHTPPSWERPTYSAPGGGGGGGDHGVRSPASTGHIDRGTTSTGTSSPSAGAGVTKTDAGSGSKAPDTKSSGERKPQ